MDGGGAEPGGAPLPARPVAPPASLFPLAWAGFLLAATTLTVFRAGSPAGLGIAAARTPARDLLAVLALGLTLLWPMTRLSVLRLGDSGRSIVLRTMGDTAVIFTPAAAVILATQMMIGWGWQPTAALLLMLASWCSLIGALLALGMCAAGAAGRSGWMALVVLVALGAPGALALLGAGAPPAHALSLFSPVTGAYALTDSASGEARLLSSMEWLASLAPGLLSAPLWALAWGRNPGRRRVDSPQPEAHPAPATQGHPPGEGAEPAPD